MILSAIAAKLKQCAKADFKGRHYEATLIVQAVSWYLRYPPQLPRHRGAVPGARPGGRSQHPEPLGSGLRVIDRETAASVPQTPLWLGAHRRDLHQGAR